MTTHCGSFEDHDPHDWAIAPNPGEDGPDWFWCDGGAARLRYDCKVPGDRITGPVDTSRWELP
jgi:hypothetical protein